MKKSIYSDIKTAKELIEYTARHGVSTEDEDICRMQDILGRSNEGELQEIARDDKIITVGRTYSSTFYFIIFHVWSWKEAVDFWNQTSNRELDFLKKQRDKLLAQVKALQEAKAELEKKVDEAIDDAVNARGIESDKETELKAKDLEILRLKAKLYDLMESK